MMIIGCDYDTTIQCMPHANFANDWFNFSLNLSEETSVAKLSWTKMGLNLKIMTEIFQKSMRLTFKVEVWCVTSNPKL